MGARAHLREVRGARQRLHRRRGRRRARRSRPSRPRALCDRRFGVGADGVLLVLPPRAPGPTRACASSTPTAPSPRCAATACAASRSTWPRGRGHHRRDRAHRDRRRRCAPAWSTTGRAAWSPSTWASSASSGDRARRRRRAAASSLTLADAGNPHAVLFGAFARGDVEHLGPRLATHAAFPRGTNVEFACVVADGIDLVVWERGVGITLACGTGACATVAVACAQGARDARRSPCACASPAGAST